MVPVWAESESLIRWLWGQDVAGKQIAVLHLAMRGSTTHLRPQKLKLVSNNEQ